MFCLVFRTGLRAPFAAAMLALALSGCEAKLELNTKSVAPSNVDFAIEDFSVTTQGAQVAWQSLSEISRYEVLVARDAACSDAVRQVTVTQASQTAFADLLDGEYHVCVYGYVNDIKFAARNNGLMLSIDRVPPAVNLGLDRIAREPVDLLPTVDDTAVTFRWQKISGPGDLTFSDDKSKVTNVRATIEGDFVIRLTVTDAVGNAAFDELVLTWDTTPPAVNAGGDVTIGATTTIVATVTGASTMQWEKVSGPGAITFGSATEATTSVSADQDGVYVLRLTASDIAGNSASDELTFTWDTSSPTVAVGADRAEKAQFTVTPTHANANAFSWTKQSGPGTLTFGTPNAASTTISADTDGTYTVRLTATNTLSGNAAFDEFVLTWDTSVPSFTSLALANGAANAYVNNAEITANAALVSAVVGTGYETAAYKVAPSADDCTTDVTYDQPANTVPLAGALSALANGSYKVCVRLSDAAGHTPAYGDSATFSLDKTLPTISSFALANGASDGYVNAADVTADAAIVALTASGQDTTTFKIVASTVTDCSTEDYSSGTSATPPTAGGLGADGSYKVCVRLTDDAGNPPAHAITGAFAKDVGVPTITSFALANDVADGALNIADNAANAEVVALTASGGSAYFEVVASTVTDCSSGVTYDGTADLVPKAADVGAAGSYKVCVRVMDAAGNQVSAITSAFAKDVTAPPALDAFSAAPHADLAGILLSLGFPATTSDYHTVTIRQIAGATAPAAACNDGTVVQTYNSGTGFAATSADATGLTAGNVYSYRVCVLDAVGNLTSSNVAANVKASGLNTWDYSAAGSYTFDSSLIGVSGGFASLLPVDQTDHDATVFGFGGGVHGGTRWDTNALTMNASAVGGNLPLYSSFYYGTDPTNLVLLTHFNGIGYADGSAVHDDAGRHGTLSTSDTNWKTVRGRHGMALEFDGSDDLYSVPDHADLNFSGDFTLIAWIKTSTTSTLSHRILSKQPSASADLYQLRMINHKAQMQIKGDATLYTVSGTSDLNDGKWHQVIGQRSGSTIHIYVDGKLEGSTAAAAEDITNTEPLAIGRLSFSVAEAFLGAIDEVAIFKRALSAAEITQLYDRQVATVFPSAWADASSLGDGLVLLTHLDEASGSIEDASAFDASGTPVGTISYASPGKIGTALRFNGSNSYVNFGSSTRYEMSTRFSGAAWINPTAYPGANQMTVFNREGEYEIGVRYDGNIIYAVANPNNTWNGWNDTGVTAPIGQWTHVAMTFSSTDKIKVYVNGRFVHEVAASGALGDVIAAQDDLRVGNRTLLAEIFQGDIDEFALWNRTLSASEVAMLHQAQKGGYQGNAMELPANGRRDGWIAMNGNVFLARLNEPDAKDGVKVVDYSGKGFDGTLTTGDALVKSVDGRLYGALTFDGDDVVTMPNAAVHRPATDMTVCAWANWDQFYSDSTGHALVGSATGLNGFLLSQGAAAPYNTARFRVIDGGGGSRIIAAQTLFDTGKWYHVCGVHEGLLLKIYVGGKLEGETATAGGITWDAAAVLTLGKTPFSASYFRGKLDEVALWNRALSAAEIARMFSVQSPKYQAVFESRLMDKGGNGSWESLSANLDRPYGKALPNNGQTETGYAHYDANGINLYANSALLLHGDDCATVTDSSPFSYAVTNLGNKVTCTSDGLFGGALRFNEGDNSCLDLGDVLDIRTGDLTVSMWVRTVDQEFSLISKSVATSGDRWAVINQAMAGGLHAFIQAYSYTGENGPKTNPAAPVNHLSDGSWHHVATTYDRDGVMTLYVDGAAYGSTDISALASYDISTNYHLFVGCYNNTGDGLTPLTNMLEFTGDMDEIAAWTRALSAAEVRELYLRGAMKARFQVRSCDLTGCDDEPWQGTDGSASTFLSTHLNGGANPQSLTFSSFPSMTIGSGRFFQYRAFLATDASTDLPRISSVAIGPNQFPTQASITVNTGVAYSQLTGFSETLGAGSTGDVSYQLSRDNTNWYYHDGTTWVAASLASHANSAADLDSRVSTFHSVVGTGTLYVKAFLNSPSGTEEVSLDQVSVSFFP